MYPCSNSQGCSNFQLVVVRTRQSISFKKCTKTLPSNIKKLKHGNTKLSTIKGQFLQSYITKVLNQVDKECTKLRCQFCLFQVEAWKRRVLKHRRRLYLLTAASMSPFSAMFLSALSRTTAAHRKHPVRFMLFLWCCRPFLFLLNCKSSTSD